MHIIQVIIQMYGFVDNSGSIGSPSVAYFKTVRGIRPVITIPNVTMKKVNGIWIIISQGQ